LIDKIHKQFERSVSVRSFLTFVHGL